MSAIGNVIGKAVDSALDMQSGTTLQDFLSKFSSSDSRYVDMIDPFSSFDVTIKFHPNQDDLDNASTKKDEKKLLNAIGNAAKNLVNNATGGIVGAIINGKKESIVDMQEKFPKAGKHTFLEYLAEANMLVGSENWLGEKDGQTNSPLMLQLGLYCQEATIPNIDMPQTGSSIVNQFGEFPINGMIVKTDSNVLTLKIVNTKVPLHERIFYPWLREVSLPYWSYQSQPYTTATITIDFTKHSDIKYVFCGCRPSKIMLQQPTQDASSSNLTRDVYFLFDFMFIHSSLKTYEDLKSKLMSAGKTLFNSASKMLGA